LGFLQQSSDSFISSHPQFRIYKYRGTQFLQYFSTSSLYISYKSSCFFLKGKTNIECSLSDRRFVFSMQKYKSRFCSKNLLVSKNSLHFTR
jgi:hypothetical protein